MEDVTDKLVLRGGNGGGNGGGGYSVKINGFVVNFASEADFLRARQALVGDQQSNIPEFNTRPGGGGGGGGGGSSILRVAADAAETVTGVIDARTLQDRRDEFQNIADTVADARAKLAAQSATNPGLVPPILEMFDAFGDAISSTISNLESDSRSSYVRAGIGGARTASDLIGSSGGSGSGSNALLLGGLGLGGGVLLAEALGRPRRRKR